MQIFKSISTHQNFHPGQNNFFSRFCDDINQRKNTSPFTDFNFCFFQPYLMRNAHLMRISSKKIHHFGPIFWPMIDRLLTIFYKNFNRYCARARRFCSIFDLVFFPTMRIQILSSASHPHMRMRINPHKCASPATA